MLDEEFIHEVLKAVNFAKIPEGWNEAITPMISKKWINQRKWHYFGLLAYTMLSVKVIFRMLENRLKKILPEIIGETQSVFVPRRFITDNVLVVYESIHAIKKLAAKKLP
jgi:hypothetical protein